MTVGLTGGIGTGKSTVAKMFAIIGYPLFNSDEAARQTYFNPEIKKKVEALLGAEAYVSDSVINKSYISSRIFSNTELLHQLNAIIHPAVMETFLEFVKRQSGKIIIKESALLFEAGLEKQSDQIIVVTAPDELRIKRVMERDGISREEVLKKIKSQLPQETKIKKADFVIYNDEQKSLMQQVLEVDKVLRNRF